MAQMSQSSPVIAETKLEESSSSNSQKYPEPADGDCWIFGEAFSYDLRIRRILQKLEVLPDEEDAMLWIAEQLLQTATQCPPPWIPQQKNDQIYFVHSETGKSQWDPPNLETAKDKVKYQRNVILRTIKVAVANAIRTIAKPDIREMCSKLEDSQQSLQQANLRVNELRLALASAEAEHAKSVSRIISLTNEVSKGQKALMNQENRVEANEGKIRSLESEKRNLEYQILSLSREARQLSVRLQHNENEVAKRWLQREELVDEYGFSQSWGAITYLQAILRRYLTIIQQRHRAVSVLQAVARRFVTEGSDHTSWVNVIIHSAHGQRLIRQGYSERNYDDDDDGNYMPSSRPKRQTSIHQYQPHARSSSSSNNNNNYYHQVPRAPQSARARIETSPTSAPPHPSTNLAHRPHSARVEYQRKVGVVPPSSASSSSQSSPALKYHSYRPKSALILDNEQPPTPFDDHEDISGYNIEEEDEDDVEDEDEQGIAVRKGRKPIPIQPPYNPAYYTPSPPQSNTYPSNTYIHPSNTYPHQPNTQRKVRRKYPQPSLGRPPKVSFQEYQQDIVKKHKPVRTTEDFLEALQMIYTATASPAVTEEHHPKYVDDYWKRKPKPDDGMRVSNKEEKEVYKLQCLYDNLEQLCEYKQNAYVPAHKRQSVVLSRDEELWPYTVMPEYNERMKTASVEALDRYACYTTSPKGHYERQNRSRSNYYNSNNISTAANSTNVSTRRPQSSRPVASTPMTSQTTRRPYSAKAPQKEVTKEDLLGIVQELRGWIKNKKNDENNNDDDSNTASMSETRTFQPKPPPSASSAHNSISVNQRRPIK